MVESNSTTLEDVFKAFAGGKTEMDNKQFSKMCKDTKILDKKVTTTDVDISFTKFSNKTNKKCNFSQWKQVLDEFAKKKGIQPQDLYEQVQKAGGPQYTGTKTDNVRLHDDKSTYTGVYGKGGPSTVDAGKGKIGDLSQLCDRTEADNRGVKK